MHKTDTGYVTQVCEILAHTFDLITLETGVRQESGANSAYVLMRA